MSPLSSLSSNLNLLSHPNVLQEGRYRILTFLNLENGGPGPQAVCLAIATAILLYVIPRRVSSIFPVNEDQYPMHRQRMAIGNYARNYLQQNPGLQRAITLAADTVYIAASLYILFHRQLQQGEFLLVASCFPATCLLIHGMRIALYSAALLVRENGSGRISAIANRVVNFIRPNVWYPGEPIQL